MADKVRRGALGVLRAPLFPGVFQWLFLALLVAICFELYLGPESDDRNAGTLLIWYVWWAALPFSFVLVGRLWCGLCPFPLVSEGLQRFAGVRRGPPPALTRWGAWVLFACFFGMHLVNLFVDFEENVRATFWLVQALLLASLVAALLFSRRAWCRYLCPLGSLAGALSMNSWTRLERDVSVCRSRCAEALCEDPTRPEAACPVYLEPRTSISPRDCNFCGRCVKHCPHDALYLEFAPPTTVLAAPRRLPGSESALPLLLLGIVLSMSLKHMAHWPILMWSASQALSVGITPTAEIVFLVAVSLLPLGLFAGAAALATAGGWMGWTLSFRRFAGGSYPLLLAAVAAMHLQALLVAGPAGMKSYLFDYGIRWGWLNFGHSLAGWPIAGLRCLLVAGGIWACFRVWARTGAGHRNLLEGGEARRWPYYLFTVGLGACLLWIFSQTMVT